MFDTIDLWILRLTIFLIKRTMQVSYIFVVNCLVIRGILRMTYEFLHICTKFLVRWIVNGVKHLKTEGVENYGPQRLWKVDNINYFWEKYSFYVSTLYVKSMVKMIE